MRLGWLGLTAGLVSAVTLAAPAESNGDWATYGHDKGGQRHSPLTEITPANVSGRRRTDRW